MRDHHGNEHPLQSLAFPFEFALWLAGEVGKVARFWLVPPGEVGIRYLVHWSTFVGLLWAQLVMETGARHGPEGFIIPTKGDVWCIRYVYATYLMLLVHVVASIYATARGRLLHPWEMGPSWLDHLGLPHKLTRWVLEPSTIAAVGWGFQSTSPNLSKYFYMAAACMCVGNLTISFRDHQRTEIMLAEYLDSQYAAERFRRRIGDN